jgi:pyridoxine/pyridoxamine 5'-phosphate oxidase
METGPGRTFSIGGVAAIIALLLQVFVSRPAGVKLGAIAAQLAASPPANERERLSAEAERLRRRNATASLAAVLFGLLAASAMAIARYV